MREIPVETCNIPAVLTSIREKINSGILLETLESCEKNVFYHITEEDEDEDHGDQSCSYTEHSYFAPVILPQHQEVSVLVLSYKWKNSRDFDFSHFIENWGLLRCVCGFYLIIRSFVYHVFSGVGNLLAFLLKKYQVGGVRFLRESIPIEEQMLNKRGPTFLILIDVCHKPEDLVYLLDFVQRTRKELLT